MYQVGDASLKRSCWMHMSVVACAVASEGQTSHSGTQWLQFGDVRLKRANSVRGGCTR